ncbi:unnamed protein product [Rotaria socialis]|uniref:Dynein light chain n=1 Tax=Rotaria socialis TaxID=392032 RepID=A0A817T8D6_9BILA|nr:unnamed protein product [Rotaria socialis]CAF3357841.1 unnamed protein product [Rotaria socialis]CAF3370064.1 unnamed protein product [Rotaria socialis]CAF3521821.1 unnamed protein product [Rotaria socialis]CAF3526988.1 unnamed protein product [Rotaria socialis]
MADSNINIELSPNEVRNLETHGYKSRNTSQRNSILISNSGANLGVNTSGNNASLRVRRESSINSFARAAYERRFIRYENTYQMEPDDEHRIDLVRIRRVATSIIETAIAGYKYDGSQATVFTMALADRIRSQMKQLPFSRYKIITQVCIGQKRGQDLRIASRCVWDSKQDRHITITKESSDAYVTATIFFIYSE